MASDPLPPSADQRAMIDLWDRHVAAEFVMKDPEAALATMTEDAYVLNVPAMTGGFGKSGVREFYSRHFIPFIPPDIEATPLSRTVGEDRIVDEAVYRFTHSLPMDWMLPGVAVTGRRVEVPVVGIIRFRDGLIASEHLHWDQASVLAQLGLLDAATPGVRGAEVAHLLLDP
jgi:carboxymethylenebutenolidase